VSKHLGIRDAIALLEKLKEVVRDVVAREEALRRESELKQSSSAKSFEAASARHALQRMEAVRAVESEWEGAKVREQGRFERRAERIRRARSASLRQALKAVDHEEGRRKYLLQKRSLQAERARDLGLAESTAEFERFGGEMGESRRAFHDLEEETRRVVSGCRGLRRILSSGEAVSGTESRGDEHEGYAALRTLEAKVRAELAGLKEMWMLRLFRRVPVWLLATLIVAGHAAWLFVLPRVGMGEAGYWEVGASAGVMLVLLGGIYFYVWRKVEPEVRKVAGDFEQARRLHDTCDGMAAERLGREQARLHGEFEEVTGQVQGEWQEAVEAAEAARAARPKRIEEKGARCAEALERIHGVRMEQVERGLREAVERLRVREEENERGMVGEHEATVGKIGAEYGLQWESLVMDWKTAIEPIYETIKAVNAEAEVLSPPWDDAARDQLMPPAKFRNAVTFGRIEVDVERLCGGLPRDERLSLPGPARWMLPLMLTYPGQGSVLFETAKVGQEEAILTINNILFRLLAGTPVDKLSLTVFDPVGLGENFAGLMHLADYEESHVQSRIWTQSGQIEERLGELNDHMEKVIQMYLRNEYATIAEYNEQAGVIAEKYHVLVIAGFPVNFSETAARRLLNVAVSGARCGVYTLIHWDRRRPEPSDFVAEDLRKSSACLMATDAGFTLAGARLPGTRLVFDAPPSPEFMTAFLHRLGRSARDSGRVEVPFDQVAPGEGELWTAETGEELRVPIGRSGATKLQYLAMGKGTRQHALVAGKTGSGKSTLFHVIITNLALWCGPDQVEFYLVDFKKGVEFKCYATRRLPHARVVAIESDREFGLSVLQRVDEELRRRGDLFRKLGVQDLAGYKRAAGAEPMPRSLLIIDEFQEFFTEEDRISQNAAVLLDRIVRQGRAFGIHALLGSQTLGGAYTLARATIGQMVIRIALQCNEADAYLIMDENNAAPRLLSRPGEGIYNDMAGAPEGNSPFQTVWLPDDERDAQLVTVGRRADRDAVRRRDPIVFEGNAPADVRENGLLREVLASRPDRAPSAPRIWLGAPNSIKGPTEVVFSRQSGSNLLVVGQRDEAILAMTYLGIMALSAQHPRGSIRFILLDSSVPGSAERGRLDRLASRVPHEMLRPAQGDLGEVLGRLAEELKEPEAGAQAGSRGTFLWVYGLQHFKKLRQEDEFGFSLGDAGQSTPAALFLRLLSEGPGRGVHVVVTCDTYGNVSRFLGRKALGEFEMRVLFQMSASDSASLVDAPDAGTLGLHRALLYNEREGYLEKFRPYALPDEGS
jgi:DNA segregation ATPase FtsK/SpoIIIE, S-DNA-T family